MAVMKYSLPANVELRTRFKIILNCALIIMIITTRNAGKITDFRMELYTVLCCVFISIYCIVLFLLIYN